MHAFNRIVMLIIALLLVIVPVLLLLIGFGVISASQANAFTGYRAALDGLDSLAGFSFDAGARAAAALVGAVLLLVAGFLLFRELSPLLGREVRRRAIIEETPGQEVAITSSAVRQLAEGAAREAGAADPSCSLATEKGRYDVECDIKVPGGRGFAETASNAQGNIRRALEEQQVPVKDVEVTVRGTTASEG